QSGSAHQCATDGEHLLFPARKRAGELPLPFRETGKEAVDAVAIRRNCGPFGTRVRTHREIFFDGEPAEYAASFGNQCDSETHHPMRRLRGHILTVIANFPGGWTNQARKR